MEIHVGSRVAEVELLNKDGNKVELMLDGKIYEVDVVLAENGACSILHNGNSYNAELVKSENSKSYRVNTHFSTYGVEIVDSQEKYLRMRRKDDEAQQDTIVAPMPGKVVKIPVAIGDQVVAGDTVVVLEAMKMQSNYKVNADCTIQEIMVQEGDSVAGGQLLIKLNLTCED